MTVLHAVPSCHAASFRERTHRAQVVADTGWPRFACYTRGMTQQLQTEPAELAQRVVDELSEKQVEDIALLDVSKISGFTDYFVVGTAGNERQMKAVMDALDRDLGLSGVRLGAARLRRGRGAPVQPGGAALLPVG